MDEFKVGDKVKCLSGTGWWCFEEGDLLTVVAGWTCSIGLVTMNALGDYPEDFELVEDFNMKTQPWIIRISNQAEYDVAQAWLKENFGEKHRARYKSEYLGLTNAYDHGTLSSWPLAVTAESLEATLRHEIKLTQKIEVEWPVVPTESPQQLKIKELEQTIEQAKQQLQELKENI